MGWSGGIPLPLAQKKQFRLELLFLIGDGQAIKGVNVSELFGVSFRPSQRTATMDMSMPTESKKIVGIFAAASFLNDMGSDIIYPIWPLFLRSVLGTPLVVLGFIDGLGDAIVSLSQFASGYLSDKLRQRKVFIWLGYLCGGISRLGYALSTTWHPIIPLRVLDRAGKMRGAPRDAIIADVSTRENRGRNFGILRAMDNLGAVVGITISILLLERLGYRNLFLLAAVPSIIGALLIIAFIKEHKPAQPAAARQVSFKFVDRNFKLFLFSNALFSLGAFSYSFLLLYAQDFGFRLALIPVLYLIYNSVAALASFHFGKLADRVGRRAVLAISYGLWVLVCVLFIAVPTHLAIVAAFAIYGLHKAALEVSQKTMVAELSPPAYRASSLGGFQMVIGFCALPASLLAGLLWQGAGKFVPLYLALGLSVAALLMLPFVDEGRHGEVEL